ncbi:MAG: hypothetical protein AAGA48_35370 [Myxococcota bacterium]
MTPASMPPAGARFGPYILDQSPLPAPARVGWPDLFEAPAMAFGQPVQLVMARRDNLEASFVEGARRAALVRVPGLQDVLQVGTTEDGLWWAALSPFEGRSLAVALADRPVTTRVAAAGRWMVEVARVLWALEQQGLAHHAIVPDAVQIQGNDKVFLRTSFGRPFAVSSFGPIHPVGSASAYHALERLAGLPYDGKADVYALGAVFYEALAGVADLPRLGLAGEDVVVERPAPLTVRIPVVPLGLSDRIDRMMDVDPEARPDARSLLETPISAWEGSAEWPVPPFVSPGPWVNPLLGAGLGDEAARIWVVEGPTGSGRARLCEHLRRLAYAQGAWPFTVTCRYGRLARGLRSVETWETLAQERPVVLIVEQLEAVDSSTAAVLETLAERRTVAVVMIHEARWATPRSRDLVMRLHRDMAARVLVMPRFEPDVCARIAAGLGATVDPGSLERPMSPRAVVELAWRRTPNGARLGLPPADGWALVVAPEPLPHAVAASFLGPVTPGDPWLVVRDEHVTLAGPTALRLAAARLEDPARAAEALASVYEDEAPDAYEAIAVLKARAGMADALEAAERAAIDAVERGDWHAAKDWLAAVDDPLSFDLCVASARYALARRPVEDAVARIEAVEARVDTRRERAWARWLRVELALREGQRRKALVKALTLTSGDPIPPTLQVRALAAIVEARLALGERTEAAEALTRLRGQLPHSDASLDAARVASTEAAWAESEGAWGGVQAACAVVRQRANRHRAPQLRGLAWQREGRVDWWRGDLPAAEKAFVESLRAFDEAGDNNGIATTKALQKRLAWEQGRGEEGSEVPLAVVMRQARYGERPFPELPEEESHEALLARIEWAIGVYGQGDAEAAVARAQPAMALASARGFGGLVRHAALVLAVDGPLPHWDQVREEALATPWALHRIAAAELHAHRVDTSAAWDALRRQALRAAFPPARRLAERRLGVGE